MRLSRRAEDYLRTIYELQGERVRVKDIAAALGVKPPSVTEMLRRLQELGLVRYTRRGVSLTREGERVAGSIKDRHEAIVELLRMMGVPEETARRDAHRMEHVISVETIEHIKRFVGMRRGG